MRSLKKIPSSLRQKISMMQWDYYTLRYIINPIYEPLTSGYINFMDSTQRVRSILSFVHAADLGSFSAAGRALGISAAAVSKNIAGLEKSLDVRLMNRTTRTLSLTDEGETFFRKARIALDALDAATESVVAKRATPAGNVRISTSVDFGRLQLVPVLPEMLQQYPDLSVDVDFDDRIIDLVHDKYDIAFRGGQITDSSLISRQVCQLHRILVASPAYLDQYGVPKLPTDLMHHKLLTRRFLGGKTVPWIFDTENGSSITLDTQSALMTFSSPEILTQMAVSGVGVANVGVHLAWKYLVTGQLKVLLLDIHNPGSFAMTLQYPHRVLIAPRVRVVVDYLLDAFSKQEELHVGLSELYAFKA